MLMGGFCVALLVGMVYGDESTQIQPARDCPKSGPRSAGAVAAGPRAHSSGNGGAIARPRPAADRPTSECADTGAGRGRDAES